MPTPPSFRKVNPADSPILYLAMRSTTLPLTVVDEYAETQLAQRISTIPGVAQVQVYGSQKYAVRIQVDPDRLAARGIGLDEVSRPSQSANVNQPTGTLEGPHQTFAIRANGQLNNAAAYRPLVVAYRNGAPVRLGEVANVIDSVENNKRANWLGDGQRAPSSWPSSASPAPTPSPRWRRIKAILPALPGQAARLDPAVRAVRPQRFHPASRSTRCSSP